MNPQAANEWLTDLESDPMRVQLHMTQLEETIQTCMDRIYKLAKQGETVKKMQLVALSIVRGWFWIGGGSWEGIELDNNTCCDGNCRAENSE